MQGAHLERQILTQEYRGPGAAPLEVGFQGATAPWRSLGAAPLAGSKGKSPGGGTA